MPNHVLNHQAGSGSPVEFEKGEEKKAQHQEISGKKVMSISLRYLSLKRKTSFTET
jgi:hypothetical protein